MTNVTEPNVSTTDADELTGKYLTFILGSESYAIPVLKVREIIRLTSITAVPQMPTHIRGVINLRGKIIPVMDLRRRFALTETTSNEQNCIVVVQIHGGTNRLTVMGLIVDAVEEVTQLTAADIEKTPDFGARIATECLLGMAKVKGVVKALLNIDQVIGGDALASLVASPALTH